MKNGASKPKATLHGKKRHPRSWPDIVFGSPRYLALGVAGIVVAVLLGLLVAVCCGVGPVDVAVTVSALLWALVKIVDSMLKHLKR